MALHAHLYANGTPIGYVYIQRRDRERAGPDMIGHYDWTVDDDEKKITNPRGEPLEHRFGDGAWALMAKVLNAAQEQRARGEPRGHHPNVEIDLP